MSFYPESPFKYNDLIKSELENDMLRLIDPLDDLLVKEAKVTIS